MIKSITINDIKALPISWANEVPWMKSKKGKNIAFSDGLNLVIGPNGSGKSSLIKMLARYMHCEQGGVSTITQHSIRELVSSDFKGPDKFLDGATIEHDGQVVIYSGDNVVGVTGGGFDDDFFGKGLNNIWNNNHSSSGQKTIAKFNEMIDNLNAKEITGLDFGNCVNSVWANKFNLSLGVLNHPTLEAGKRTILLDEPDVNLDLLNQMSLLKTIKEMSVKFQVIMTAHSAFALLMEDVHVIETKAGYYNKVKKQIIELSR